MTAVCRVDIQTSSKDGPGQVITLYISHYTPFTFNSMTAAYQSDNQPGLIIARGIVIGVRSARSNIREWELFLIALTSLIEPY